MSKHGRGAMMKSAYAAAFHDTEHATAPSEPEHRGEPAMPDPGHTTEQMAQQLAEDEEFKAWYHTEVRGLIGRG